MTRTPRKPHWMRYRAADGGFGGVCSDLVHVKQTDDLCANATRPCAGCNCKRFTAEEKAAANAIADKYKLAGRN
jgi:hypothetical protein